MTQGIYQIYFEYDDISKWYIGQSRNIDTRWKHHLHYLRKGTHNNSHMQKDFSYYGEQYFYHSTLEVVTDITLLKQREQYWIDVLFEQFPLSQIYNIKKHAQEFKLREVSDVTRERMRQARLGMKFSEEHRAKIGAAHKGKKKLYTAIKRRGVGISNNTKDLYANIWKNYCNGMKPIEISMEYDLPHNTVRSILYRLRKQNGTKKC